MRRLFGCGTNHHPQVRPARTGSHLIRAGRVRQLPRQQPFTREDATVIDYTLWQAVIRNSWIWQRQYRVGVSQIVAENNQMDWFDGVNWNTTLHRQHNKVTLYAQDQRSAWV
jgi:hypothetical protein